MAGKAFQSGSKEPEGSAKGLWRHPSEAKGTPKTLKGIPKEYIYIYKHIWYIQYIHICYTHTYWWDIFRSKSKTQKTAMNFTIHKCVRNGNAFPNPNQYTKIDNYKVKTRKSKLLRNWSNLVRNILPCRNLADRKIQTMCHREQRFPL